MTGRFRSRSHFRKFERISSEFFRIALEISLEYCAILSSTKQETQKQLTKIESEEMNMLNFLDLLVIVFMVLAAVSLLALCLMFLVRNPRIKKVCFYIVSALSIYTGYIGVRIGNSLFPVQTAVGLIVAAVSIAAIVLAATARDNQKNLRLRSSSLPEHGSSASATPFSSNLISVPFRSIELIMKTMFNRRRLAHRLLAACGFAMNS